MTMLGMTYQHRTDSFILRFQRHQFRIGVVELRGLTVQDLEAFNPDDSGRDFWALSMCQNLTYLREQGQKLVNS